MATAKYQILEAYRETSVIDSGGKLGSLVKIFTPLTEPCYYKIQEKDMTLPKLTDEKRAWYILQGYEIIVNEYGTRSWWLNGKRHREDGPAVEWESGNNFWYLDGVFVKSNSLSG